MPKVTFLPVNIVCEARKGDTILDVAIRNDVPIQHACGGFCACTTCHIYVKSGQDLLVEPDGDELDRLERVSDLKPESRLGCQTKIQGDIVVEIVNLD